jgi:hypothetical protein
MDIVARSRLLPLDTLSLMTSHEVYLFAHNYHLSNRKMTNFLDIVNTLSLDELRTRLAAYMAADAQYMSPLVAIEVRPNTAKSP